MKNKYKLWKFKNSNIELFTNSKIEKLNNLRIQEIENIDQKIGIQKIPKSNHNNLKD